MPSATSTTSTTKPKRPSRVEAQLEKVTPYSFVVRYSRELPRFQLEVDHELLYRMVKKAAASKQGRAVDGALVVRVVE